MPGSVDDFQLNWSLDLLVCAQKFERLIDRHLRILIAVEQQQGRIAMVHMKNWTGKLCQRGHGVRLSAKQQVKRRHTNLQTMRCGLVQDRREIRRAIKTHDSLHIGALSAVVSDVALQLRIPI